MKNEYFVVGEVVEMIIDGVKVIFDLDDFEKVNRFATWKMARSKSIVADYRDGNKMIRVLLHRIISESKFVTYQNGNVYDFRKCNLKSTEKIKKPRPFGIGIKHNPFRVEGETVILGVMCEGKLQEVYVDCEDFMLVSRYLWNVNPKTGYVQAKERLPSGCNKGVYIHRLVIGAKGFHEQVDHINGNKLDNRKSCNLRICNQSQNNHNKRSADVGFSKLSYERWNARMKVNGTQLLKQFKTYQEALAQRQKWEYEFGSHCRRSRTGNSTVGVNKVFLEYWQANIRVGGTVRSRKFKTREEAIAQRRQWEKELNPSGLNR